MPAQIIFHAPMKRPKASAGSAAKRTAMMGCALFSTAVWAAAEVPAAAVYSALERPAVHVQAAEKQMLLSTASAGSRLVAVGERGIVVLSEDDGQSWKQIASPVSVTLTAVRFADTKTGVIVGHGGTVLTTSDGGNTWSRRLDGRTMARLTLENARLTQDAKAIANAERLVAEGPDKPLLDVLVLSALEYVVVGAYGLAFATVDGGTTWTSWAERLPNPKGLHLYAIRHSGSDVLVAGEQGLVLRSQDSGRTFQALNVPYRGSWFTAELGDSQEMLLGGLRGNVWRSTDAGANWLQVTSPSTASITASTRLTNGSVLLCNQAGYVMQLRGDQLVPINSVSLGPLNGLLSNNTDTVHALGSHGVIRLQR